MKYQTLWNIVGISHAMWSCAFKGWFFQNGCRCHENGQKGKKLKNTKMIQYITRQQSGWCNNNNNTKLSKSYMSHKLRLDANTEVPKRPQYQNSGHQPIPHFKILLGINFHWHRRPLTIWRFYWQPFWKNQPLKDQPKRSLWDI
jgi:hypothetical protein